MRLFISNLPEGITADELRERFESFGDVVDVCIPASRRLGQEVVHRNFAHVEIDSDDVGVMGKCIKAVRVLLAAPRPEMCAPLATWQTLSCLQYNNSNWRGKKLGVALANPTFREYIAAEAAEPAPVCNPHLDLAAATIRSMLGQRLHILPLSSQPLTSAANCDAGPAAQAQRRCMERRAIQRADHGRVPRGRQARAVA